TDPNADDAVLPVQRAVKLWASNTNGRAVSHVVMQTDGNLVIYSPGQICNNPRLQKCDPFNTEGAIWASNSYGWSGSRLIVQDDGNAVIYNESTPIWATDTNR